MLLSIIIPAYNCEKYIKETIDSIKEQKFQDWECIIVNDGSTDNSLQVINDNIDSRFRVISIENGGVANARNVAVKEAKGKYILPVDSDDIIYEDYTEEGVEFLENNPKYSMFHCAWNGIKSNEERFNPCLWRGYSSLLNQESLLVCGILRKDRILEIGGWNTTLKRAEDYEFYLRYLYHNDKVGITNNVGYGYRILPTSRS